MVAVALACLLGGPALPARGEFVVDPEPPLLWADAIAAPSVVLATYDSHDGTVLRLKLDRVLRGSLRPGDMVGVSVEHWYRVVESPDPRRSRGPFLSYVMQGWRADEPRRVFDLSRGPALYFFPQAGAPSLRKRGQVQPEWLADGWSRVFAGARPDVLWRLWQSMDRRLRQDALEEIAESREPAVLQRLFELTETWPERSRSSNVSLFDEVGPLPSGEATLGAIGDRDGDVYDRASALLDSSPDREAKVAMAFVCAAAEPGRAVPDLVRRAREGEPDVAGAALRGLGSTTSLDALEELVAGVERRPVVQAALQGLRGLLGLEGRWYRARGPADLHRLREAARSRLDALARSDDAYVRQETRWFLAHRDLDVLPAAAPSLEEVRRLVEAAAAGTPFSTDSGLAATLAGLGRTPRPEYVPLLVESLVRIRPRQPHQHPLQGVVASHATLFRQAMRRLCEDQGVLDVDPRSAQVFQILGMRLGRPDTYDLAEWIRLHPGRSDALRRGTASDALRGRLERWADEGDLQLGTSLQALAVLEPKAARALLDRVWARSTPDPSDHRWLPLLAVRVRLSSTDDASVLIEHVRRHLATPRANGEPWHVTEWLLASDSSGARAEYLRLLDSMPTVVDTPHGPGPHWPYERSLRRLWPRHYREFLPRVERLLESKDPVERGVGEDVLSESLRWRPGGIRWTQEVARRRRAPLEEARAVLRAMSAARNELAARATYLRMRGVELPEEFSDRWIAPLRDAALDVDDSIAHPALDLLERVVGDYDVADVLGSLRRVDREPVVDAWLADRGRPVR